MHSINLNQLHDDLKRVPSVVGGWRPPAGIEAGARALAAWLEATKDPKAEHEPAIFEAIEDASRRLSDERKTKREKTLEDVALQRIACRRPAAVSRRSRGPMALFTTHGVWRNR